MSKRAIILAGGAGSRLRPYTVTLPKPLMPVGDLPILEIVIRQLSFFGFERITMAVGHQAGIIRAFCNDGQKWNVRIDYSEEKSPLGTMGPLKLISDLPDNFLIMNGDVLTDLDFEKFFKFHVDSKNLFTIASYKRRQITDFGVLQVSGDGLLTGFAEKPAVEHNVSMGIYMASKEILNYIPENQPFGFDQLVLKLIEERRPPGIMAHHGHWLDIGRFEDYQAAIEEFDRNRHRYLKGR